MNSKTSLFFLVFTFIIIFNTKVIAQQNDYVRFLMEKEIYSEDVMNKLKSTTTVFFLKKATPEELEPIKKAIVEVWKLTPLIFDDISKFNQYAANPKYSYISIEGVTYLQSGVTLDTHFYLALRLFNDISTKGKIHTIGLCRLELFASNQTCDMVKKNSKNDDAINNVYNNGIFYNWNPILLKAKLGAAQADLKNNIRPWLFESGKDKNFSKLISTDTLYVPEDVLIRFSMGVGMFSSSKEKKMTENVFENFKYKYRICSKEELYKIFEIEKRGRLLFEYVKSATDKFINVYDMKDNKVLYKKYTPLSNNLKNKDIEDLE